MTGRVNSSLEATLELELFGADGKTRTVEALIDTGFTGALTLPIEIIQVLGLRHHSVRTVTLGDESQRNLLFFEGEITWLGAKKRVTILCVEGVPLIGTALLSGCRAEISFERGGPVLLSPIDRAKNL